MTVFRRTEKRTACVWRSQMVHWASEVYEETKRAPLCQGVPGDLGPRPSRSEKSAGGDVDVEGATVREGELKGLRCLSETLSVVRVLWQ